MSEFVVVVGGFVAIVCGVIYYLALCKTVTVTVGGLKIKGKR